MKVTVAYATPEKQVELPVELEVGATVEEAIQASGVLQLFAEIDLAELSVGIFSKRAKLSDNLRDGDRVEIYRPLQVDPKEARRLRAKAQKAP